MCDSDCCLYLSLFFALISLILGYAIGHGKGHKEGRVEGARLRMSEETYENSPLKGSVNIETLNKARTELDKQIKPKEKTSDNPKSLTNDVALGLLLVLLFTFAYIYLSSK